MEVAENCVKHIGACMGSEARACVVANSVYRGGWERLLRLWCGQNCCDTAADGRERDEMTAGAGM